MKVAAYTLQGNGLAQRLVPIMAAGAAAAGDDVSMLTVNDYKDKHLELFDTAIMWGYVPLCQKIMSGFQRAGKPLVYLDLGYWARGTHYKVAVGSRHPTAYFQKVKHDDSRLKQLGITAQPWRHERGSSILLAGLSQKAAGAEQLGPWGALEEGYFQELRKHTDRPVIYRAKGSPNQIAGTHLSLVTSPLAPILRKCWAVVTHRSNVAVDGLVEGIPAFAQEGVASVLALQDLSLIESPRVPEDREQWMNDIAYCQWSEAEMRGGMCWRHLKEENLVP